MFKPNIANTEIAQEMPLSGKSILVTRPYEQGVNFAAKLDKLGAKTILLPLIEIADPDSWEKLDAAIETIDYYDWLIFASSNAVTAFIKRLLNKDKLDYSELSKQKQNRIPASANEGLPKIAAIGPVTKETAIKFGLKVDYCPSNYLAKDFIAQFPGYPDNLSNTKILWPRTNLGNDLILEKLKAAGAAIEIVAAYKSNFPSNAEEMGSKLKFLIERKQIDVITLFSKQTAINLAEILCLKINAPDISRNLLSPPLPNEGAIRYLAETLANILIVTIGPEASEGALNYLSKLNLEANPHTAEGMIATLTQYYYSQ